MYALSRIMEPLAIVRRTAEGDTRTNVKGALQSDKATFAIGVDIEEGDLVEQPVAGGKVKTYRATNVTHHKAPARAARITVQIEPVSTKAAVAPRRVQIANMHPEVSNAAGTLFVDGHYSRAVFAAFQALDHRVQQETGINDSGVSLMHHAFSPQSPLIDLARLGGRNGDDERKGFHLLMAGAILALRNPRGHGQDLPDSPEEALEYLALASGLMRRLDVTLASRRP
jgi:uncharacterized protein (TIGR02391 family)